MNYQDAKLRRMLAAEYVLGTLRGPARRRFERLVRADAALRAEQHFWEARLGLLALRSPPVTPAPTVWIALQRRIQSGNTVALRKPAAAPPRPVPMRRIWAGMAVAAAVVVAVVVSRQGPAPVNPPPVAQVPAPAAPALVAQLKIPDSTLQWSVRFTPGGEMTVAASGDYPQLGAHSLELWWLSPQGPVPLGLLPVQGEGRMTLPREMAGGEIKLAVSLEPQGGSPTGKPTGPVLTSAAAQAA
ncbi:MAG TPA: anti-sigma factor [Nevskia sp.]|nr:anti-sigma factor [Nevskia sp.]